MFFDPSPLHSIWGKDRMPATRLSSDTFAGSLQISPYHQHTSGARDAAGKKVNLENRLGPWNMLGLFYGRAAMNHVGINADQLVPFVPVLDSSFNPFSGPYPNIAQAYGTIRTTLGGGTENTGALPENAARYTEASDPYFDLINLASGKTFLGDKLIEGTLSVPAKLERVGLRLNGNIFAFGGLGISVKSGITHYRHTPQTFTDSSTDETITRYLTDESARNRLMTELGFDIDGKSVVALEDTLVKLSYSRAIDLKDKKNNTVLKLAPYGSVGCWAPTGRKKNRKAFFSLPTGNDGFWGLVFEGGLNFGLNDSIFLGVGGGATLFSSRTINDCPVPSSKYQSTVYPWTTSIDKEPGVSWDVNLSLHVDDFIEGFHFYADYVYSRHERDSIKVNDATTVHLKALTLNDAGDQVLEGAAFTVARSTLFDTEKMEKESEWMANTVNAGVNLTLSPLCELGLGFQTHISGFRVYKTLTIMGTMSFCF